MRTSARTVSRVTAIVVAILATVVLGVAAPAAAHPVLTWSSFPQVSGEDRIELTIQRDAWWLQAGEIRICLSSATGVTWWKAVKVFDPTHPDFQSWASTQDANHGPSCLTTWIYPGIPEYKMEFWKAKFLGIHTPMYEMAPGSLASISGLGYGTQVNLLWTRD